MSEERPPSDEPTVKLPAWRRRRLARGSVPPKPRRWWHQWAVEDTLFTVCTLAVFGLVCIYITYLPECGP